MTTNLMAGVLLDAGLKPVTGSYQPRVDYRLGIPIPGGSPSGAIAKASTIAARIYKPIEGKNVFMRWLIWVYSSIESRYWKKVRITDPNGNTVDLSINLNSARKFLKALRLNCQNTDALFESENSLRFLLEAEALKNRALESGCNLRTDRLRERRHSLANILAIIQSSKEEWKRANVGVRLATEEGDLISYNPEDQSIKIAFGGVLIDYETKSFQKDSYLAQLSPRERKQLHQYLALHHRELTIEAANDKEEISRLTGGSSAGVVYKTPKDTEYKIPRAIQVDEHGRVVIHFNSSQEKQDKLLGSGSFKKVKTAIDIDSGKTYASVSIEDPTLEFFNTLSLLRSLPHSVQFHGITYIKHDSRVNRVKVRLLMEFCKEGDLEHIIRRKKSLSYREKLKVFKETIRSLRQLHDHGFVHRDIKPANFLIKQVEREGVVVLADHDLICEEKDDKVGVNPQGTPCYFSPEYLQACIGGTRAKMANATTKAHDVWGLGCTLYEVLHDGAYPEFMPTDEEWRRMNFKRQLAKIERCPIPPPSQERSLDYIVYKMLQVDPEERISLSEAERRVDELLSAVEA